MTTSITPFIHFACVYELLITTYGEPKNEPDYDTLGGLVGTILSPYWPLSITGPKNNDKDCQ